MIGDRGKGGGGHPPTRTRGVAELARSFGPLALSIGGGMSEHNPTGSIPDPKTMGPVYQKWMAPEVALEVSEASTWLGFGQREVAGIELRSPMDARKVRASVDPRIDRRWTCRPAYRTTQRLGGGRRCGAAEGAVKAKPSDCSALSASATAQSVGNFVGRLSGSYRIQRDILEDASAVFLDNPD